MLTGHTTKANCVYRQLPFLSRSWGSFHSTSPPASLHGLTTALHCSQQAANRSFLNTSTPFLPCSLRGVIPSPHWLWGSFQPATHCCPCLPASPTSLQGEKENKRVWMIGLVMTLEIPFWQCTKSSLKALKSFLKIRALNRVAGPGQIIEPTSLSHAGSSLSCTKTLPFQLGLSTVPYSAAFPFLVSGKLSWLSPK